MLNMKYKDSQETYTVNFKRISDKIIELCGDFPVKRSGFVLSRIGKEDGWDYSAYKTVYKEIENGVQFSNDGSIYIPPEPVPEPDLPNYEPTPEELAEQEQRRKEAEAVPTNEELAAAVIELAENMSDVEDAVAELGAIIGEGR